MKKVKSIDEYIKDFSDKKLLVEKERFLELRKIINEILEKEFVKENKKLKNKINKIIINVYNYIS
jgi:hypothetical protein